MNILGGRSLAMAVLLFSSCTPGYADVATGENLLKGHPLSAIDNSTTTGAPGVTLSSTTLAFGNQAVNTRSAPKTATLKNTGTTSLTLTAISLTGSQAHDFSLSKTCGSSLAAGASCSISVSFTPILAGAKTSSVSIADNASGSPQIIALSGTGTTTTGATTVTLNPTSLAFGNQTVNTASAAKTVTLKNTGSANLTLSSVALTGSQAANFSLSKTCGTSLAAGASCNISVAFKPTSIGAKASNVSIVDSATGSPQSIALSGTGTSSSGAPAVTLSPTSLAFGDQTVNTSSAAKTITLKNTGTATLSLTSITLTGSQAHDFSLSKTCGASLAASASCNISVAFTPILTGAKTSSVSIADNGSGSPQSVALSGTGMGVAATPVFAPAGGTFSTAQTVTITDATTGATIYYTTDGTTPTTSSARYSSAISVKGTKTIKAIAAAAGYTQSAVASASYTIATAQITETVIHSFAGNPNDGEYPVAGLTEGSDGYFYGTTSQGGAYGAYNYDSGIVFKVTPGGVETVLHSFGNGSDGYSPLAPLTQDSHGNFYGTTYGGGTGVTGGYGTVYKITPSGAETIIYNFPGRYIEGKISDGERPEGALISDSAGNFYSTTMGGQDGPNFTIGTVFKMSPTGVETLLYNFAGGSDGYYPQASLTIGNDGNFYGTTEDGGEFSLGTIFKITPAGVETVIHSFGNGFDGRYPNKSLTKASDGNFYGVTPEGGTNNEGTVFKITPDGTETVLHSFGSGTDGSDPQAPLIQGSDGNLFGTTMFGGTYATTGTVYKITLDGSETVIYSFPGNLNIGYLAGEQPQSPVIQATDGNFYGMTTYGGDYGLGAIFKLSGVIQ